MRRLLPFLFIPVFLFLISDRQTFAQTPSSVLIQKTVVSQDIFSDFFSWLGNILFKNDIPKKVGNVNDAALPLGANEISSGSGQSVSAQAAGSGGDGETALKESSRQYDTAASRNTPFNKDTDTINFIEKWWNDLTQAEPTGTQQAINFYSSNLPAGVSENIVPTQAEENSAMAYALDCKKDSTLPWGANQDSTCNPTNVPLFVSPTLTPTITPAPTQGVFPTGNISYDSCPVGNDKCISKAMQEAGKPGNPDFYKKTECYWQKFLPVFGGNEVKARAASAICFRESGGDIVNRNDHCLSIYPEAVRTRDYSVGLFQINLLAHCPGALRDDWNVDKTCTIIDQNKLNACYNSWTTFDGAVAKMLELSSNGTNWNPWRTNRPDLYCEITNDQMMCVAPTITPVPYTQPSGNYVYYSQKDYKTTPYGAGCTIYDSGCGPTTLAMILSTYLGSNWTPPVVASTLLSSQSCQTYPSALITALNQEGFNARWLFSTDPQIMTDAQKTTIRNKIRNDRAIIVAGANLSWLDKYGVLQSTGHYFWITDIDENGTIYVMDPWYGAGRSYPIAQQNINSYPVKYKYIIEAYKP